MAFCHCDCATAVVPAVPGQARTPGHAPGFAGPRRGWLASHFHRQGCPPVGANWSVRLRWRELFATLSTVNDPYADVTRNTRTLRICLSDFAHLKAERVTKHARCMHCASTSARACGHSAHRGHAAHCCDDKDLQFANMQTCFCTPECRAANRACRMHAR